METLLYTVTLNDLGTYTARVAARYPEEAVTIAKELLWDAFTKPTGFAIVKRETEAEATVAQQQPHLVHSVTTWQRMKCAQMIPATDESEAIMHFQRLMKLNGCVEYFNGEERGGEYVVEQSSPNGGRNNA